MRGRGSYRCSRSMLCGPANRLLRAAVVSLLGDGQGTVLLCCLVASRFMVFLVAASVADQTNKVNFPRT